MNYRTIVKPKRYNFEISHASNILMLGSCFSENIGNKLIAGKFNTLVNPFGILFNPISIANALNSIVNKKEFVGSDLIQENGLYHSFSHHGSFSSVSIDETLKKINKSRVGASNFLRKTDTLIITFGSAWVYRHIETGKIVANCHKVSNKEFKKEILEVEEIVSHYKALITTLKAVNPELNIIFTISPVRHWKDGAVENNLSKSVLNIAIYKLVESLDNAHYFPAYEMVIDDLRDYRFFKEDMLHPNSIAVNYVWTGFKESFLTKDSLRLLDEINKITTAVNHKPFNSSSEVHQKFLKTQIKMVELLISKYPHLNFDEELSNFKNQIL